MPPMQPGGEGGPQREHHTHVGVVHAQHPLPALFCPPPPSSKFQRFTWILGGIF